MKKFSTSGTLGDTFVVYCKLYDYWRRTGRDIGLYRYSAHIDFDKPISEFFSNIPFVKYLTPCIYNKYGGIKNVKKLKAPYINVFWNGKGTNDEEPNDPDYIKMEPFPEVFIKPQKNEEQNKFHIGIQYRCGRGGKGSNRRGISLRWIRDLRKMLPPEFYSISLFGTLVREEDGEEIEKFCQHNNIKNFVDKIDLPEWLARILSLDFFITFEGFSAYFAMSQKVFTLMFYIVQVVADSLHPAWRANNVFVKVRHPWKYCLLRKSPHYAPNTYPIGVKLAKKIVEQKYATNNRQ